MVIVKKETQCTFVTDLRNSTDNEPNFSVSNLQSRKSRKFAKKFKTML